MAAAEIYKDIIHLESDDGNQRIFEKRGTDTCSFMAGMKWFGAFKMYLSSVVCLGGLVTFALGEPAPVLQYKRQYGYNFLFPTSVGTSTALTGVSPSGFSTGVPSGTAPGTISDPGSSTAPYGNFSATSSGTAYSTGVPSGTAPGTISDPGYPTAPRSNSTLSLIPLSTAVPSRTAPGTIGDPGSSTGPYSNSTSTKATYPTVGPSGTSPVTISLAGTSTAPYGNSSMGRTGTAYSSGSRAYTYSSTNSTSPSASPTSADPSAKTIGSISGSPTTTSNVTTFKSTGYPTYPTPSLSSTPAPSGDPTISINVTSITSVSGIVSISSNATVDPTLSGSATSSPSYYTAGTAVYSFSPTGASTTLDPSAKFTYTPSVKTLPSEYYHHHRRPKHTKTRGAPDYEGYGYDLEDHHYAFE
ncbi:hypothetical protein MMC28_004975 [Mycoblastus sanguinarius]|nr:hypothetical protein [Mycoblastus sanguinarius]